MIAIAMRVIGASLIERAAIPALPLAVLWNTSFGAMANLHRVGTRGSGKPALHANERNAI